MDSAEGDEEMSKRFELHVWIVTTGEYSDFHICAVFSSEARAKEYAKRFESKADYTGFFIDKWPVNPLGHKAGGE